MERHLTGDCHGLAGVPGWATRCHCLFVWAHGLLFVVGAMCSPVYCLTPPSLSRYCFSRFTCVVLVCLPIYSPGVSSPVLICCFTLCVWCLHIRQLSACLPACLSVFLSRGGFCSFLFHFIIKNPPFSCTWVLASSLFHTHDRTDQPNEDSAENGLTPASNINSPLYQRILQFQALSSIRQQGTDVRRFALTFCGAAEGLGYNDAALKDLFNSAHEEPLSIWRMRGLDHLTFGEFVEFLACSPARAAGVPQAGLVEAAAPSNSRPFPERLGLIHSVQDPPLMSVRAAWSARGLTEVVVPAHKAPEVALPAHDPPEVAVPAQDPPEAAVPAHDAPEAAVPAHSVPEAAVPAHDAPEAAVPAHDAPEAAEPAHDAPEAAVPAHVPPEAAVPAHVPPEAAVPAHVPPEAAVPAHVPPEAAVPAHDAPEAAVPAHVPPEVAVPTHVPPEAAVSAHVPPEAAVSAHVPPEAAVSAHVPPEAAVSAHVPPEAAVSAHVPPEAAVSAHRPPEAAVSAHRPPEAAVSAHRPSEAAVSTQNPPKVALAAHVPPEAAVPAHSVPEAAVPAHGAPEAALPWPPALPAPPWHPGLPLPPGPLPLHGPGPPSLPLIRLWPTSLPDIFFLCFSGGASGICSLKGGLCHGLAGVPGWATRCHCLFVWAHGLLFVVGAMCSPVYCLTPPSLSRYCFSRFTCVVLVCLPIYSPGVSSPVLICCFTLCVWCLHVRQLSVFLSRGGFCFIFVSFYY